MRWVRVVTPWMRRQVRTRAVSPRPRREPRQFASTRTRSGLPSVFLQFWHLQFSLQKMPAWKHSQYFFRHPDLRQLQPLLCFLTPLDDHTGERGHLAANANTRQPRTRWRFSGGMPLGCAPR